MYYVRRIGLFVLASSVCGKNVVAAEWELAGTLGQQLQYNDNISFSSIRKDSVFGYLLTPELHASRKTADLDLAIQGQGDIRRYTDPIWDCESFNVGANSAYRTNRSTFGLNGGYGISCTYAQQITDTGLILPNNQSENYRLAPTWTWQWTARDQLILDASYSKTSYSNSQNGIASSNNSSVFSGNDTYTVSLDENHEWSRRLTLNGKLYFSSIQYTGSNALTQDLFGFLLGANYKIDRLWTVNAAAGPLWIDTQPESDQVVSQQNSSVSLGSIANINLNYSGQRSKFSTGYSNAVNPSAIGETLETQTFFANYSYSITRHLVMDLSGNYSLSQSAGDNSIDNSNNQFDRAYFTVAAGITWDFAKQWQLKGSYAYSWQDYQQDQNVQNLNELRNLNAGTGTSDSNVVMLFLNYTWDGIRTSR
jgi:hypothetical protein